MKRVLRIVVIVAIASLGADAKADRSGISPEAFEELYIKELLRQMPNAEVRSVGEMELRIKRPGGKEFTAFLDNAYKRYLDEPELRDQILSQYVAGTMETAQSSGRKIDVSRIIPVIKNAGFLASIRRTLKARGEKNPVIEQAFDRYNDELVIMYAEDTNRNIRYLTDRALREAGLPKDRRRAAAVANLKALLPKIQVYGGKGIYALTAGGTYEASLLLFDRMWRSGKLKVKGELVAAIPARGVLVVTGSQDRAGLKRLRRVVAEEMGRGAYHLTSRLFVYRGGTFVSFGG